MPGVGVPALRVAVVQHVAALAAADRAAFLHRRDRRTAVEGIPMEETDAARFHRALEAWL